MAHACRSRLFIRGVAPQAKATGAVMMASTAFTQHAHTGAPRQRQGRLLESTLVLGFPRVLTHIYRNGSHFHVYII